MSDRKGGVFYWGDSVLDLYSGERPDSQRAVVCG